mmetsp:Transcript_13855/g.33047  ORF Transcript_13855/g.33047 Transcript_13855/m.33047 type:complete len:84 (+) Transcript_13855:315-566(+)|eukprot:s3750_g15.t1
MQWATIGGPVVGNASSCINPVNQRGIFRRGPGAATCPLTRTHRSRFVRGIRDRLETWDTKIRLASDTIDEWLQVQRAWMYLAK